METLITIMVSLTVGLQVTSHWFLSRGVLKVVYILNIFVFSCYAAMEVILALNDPSQWSMVLFLIVDFWALFMAAKGLRRYLKYNKNTNEQ